MVRGPCPADLAALADRVKVEQIILNLCSNAVKFTEAGGRGEVSCDARDGRVAGAGAEGVGGPDAGGGTAPGDGGRVWEPFVQLGRGLTPRHEGTGLGL